MKAARLAILALLVGMFGAQGTFSQTRDSSSASSASCGALQFQLIGGAGINYIGKLSRSSFFRIGADLSLNHVNQSGNESSSFSYTSSSSPASSDSTIESSNQTMNSYNVSLSALYVQELAEYKSAFLYCGVGPMLTYSWSKSTDNHPVVETSGGITTFYTNTSSSTGKTSGIGPTAIIGVRSNLVNHVGVSAEIGFSAIYQWNTQSNLNISRSTSPPWYSASENVSNVSHMNGWNVSLSSVRIGVVFDL